MSAVSSSGTTLIVSSQPSPGRARVGEPITVGVPFPRGAVKDAARIALVEDDRAVAVQALPTELWPDGSIRWALLDFQATGTFAPERRYHLTLDGGGAALHAPRVKITEAADTIVV